MLHLLCDSILYTFTVNVAIRCVSRISTLSSRSIQWKDLLVRIETPPALRAVGVSIRTYRSFHWMNTSDKVDILYLHTCDHLQSGYSYLTLTYISRFTDFVFAGTCPKPHYAVTIHPKIYNVCKNA